MSTCASCGKIEEGELEAFCQHCGERREAEVTPSPAGNAANKSEDEIVEVSGFSLQPAFFVQQADGWRRSTWWTS
jgi:NMD protein affecting ribosome stability and mRNA decay